MSGDLEGAERPSVYQSLNTARHIISCEKLMRTNKNFSEGLHQTLLAIKDLIPCDRIYVLETDCKPVRIASEWAAPGLPSASVIFSHLPESNVRNVDTVMKSQDVVVITADEFKEIYPDSYKDMMRNGLRNTLSAPLCDGGVPFGNLCLDNFDFNAALDAREFMQALAFFIASEMQTHRLMERLSALSNMDSLLGVKNRNAMNHALDELVASPGSLGVVYADLNGLKVENDSYGHEAGDRLLKRAADVLTQCFGEESVFRAGGDEFVVLMAGVSEYDFMAQVRRLGEALDDLDNLSMSYGCRYRTVCEDPEVLMREADKAMYEDKASYYGACEE